MRTLARIALCLLLAAAAPARSAPPHEVAAEAPSDVAVTVYRAPDRSAASIDLRELEGFALISETRMVQLPAGESRVRFEGVADGIVSVSAILTGLEGAVIEKNRDASLLNPGSLLAASAGRELQLLRTNRTTGKPERMAGTLISTADGGVVFQSSEGIEGLRCSGMPETFSFERSTGLSARPTLSVIVNVPQALTVPVTLSYLARGFDWAASYTAILSPDGRAMQLGAWITLANSNTVGFLNARTQIVAGRLNREDDQLEPIALAPAIIATCWERGDTAAGSLQVPMEVLAGAPAAPMLRSLAKASDALEEMEVLSGQKRVEQEQLGDLKLYRVPDRTTLESLQMKQIRLMDRYEIPVTSVYAASIAPPNLDAEQERALPALRLLRTENTLANHLGLPLPSGSFAVFGKTGAGTLLIQLSSLRDLTLAEEVEIPMGETPDVQVRMQVQSRQAGQANLIPLLPDIVLLGANPMSAPVRVEISNALARAVPFELRLNLQQNEQVLRADRPLEKKNGAPLFRLTVPAHGAVAVRFQTRLNAVNRVRP